MFFNQKLNDRLHQTQTKLKELEINLEKLDREYKKLIAETELDPDHIQGYIDEPTNFSEPIWERLQKEKKKLSDNLNKSLNLVTDPTRVKKTFAERGTIQQNWIFVK